MFSEDYLMRIINQAIAAFMIAIGLRKAGKYSEALQAVRQAIEQLTTLPENIVDEMDDTSLLTALSPIGQPDPARLAILADLYQEQGEILLGLGQSDQALAAFARSLRFILEGTLADETGLSNDNIARVESLVHRLEGRSLPVETLLALSDFYQRLLELDDQLLAAAGTSRLQVERLLSGLEERLGRLPGQ